MRPAVVLLLSFCCVTHLCGSNAIERPHPQPFSKGEGSPANRADIHNLNNFFSSQL